MEMSSDPLQGPLRCRYFTELTEMLRPIERGLYEILQVIESMRGIQFTIEEREEIQRWINRRFSLLKERKYADLCYIEEAAADGGGRG